MPYSMAMRTILFYIMTDLKSDDVYRVNYSKGKMLLLEI